MIVSRSGFWLGLCAAFALGFADAQAQLRIVTYNTATAQAGGTQTARQPFSTTILEAIGLESVNGLARPIDVLLLQEQFSMQVTTQSFVDLLNDLYDPVNRTMYARSTVNGQISNTFNGAGGRPGLIYNTHTVQFFADEQIQVGNENVGSGANQQPRVTMRYKLRPVGYDESANFYVYNSHYSASLASQRNAEAQVVRANADALPSDAHIIYAGDFNINSSNVQSYQILAANGPGQAIDPLNKPGIWSDRQYFNNDPNQEDIRYLHTQSPAIQGEHIPGYAFGGMDDRYDFQLVTSEFLDGEGLSYLPGSYRAFGNNGTHDLNGNITTGWGAEFDILDALMKNSDHLPVVADYQIPAKMLATLATVPNVVGLGSTVGIDLFVQNVANVLNAAWADELDYTINVSGSLSGAANGIGFAATAASLHEILLDTSTPGLHTGMVTVSTTSQGAANPFYQFGVEYSVVEFLAGDFNQDGYVNGDDLLQWQGDYGLNGDSDADGDGDSDGRDFLIWQREFGISSFEPLASSLATTVPEPGSATLLGVLAGALLVARRPTPTR